MDVVLVTAPVVEPTPADTEDDDKPHVVCAHRDVTWCGIKATGPTVPPPTAIEKVCRMCILAIEMWDGRLCPVCGCRRCIA